ncbi:hypothetical protein [uncultured Metabacillus sp.]|uniref:hypothetical protein n=1 Tax=uncultured Metabacillus sp. TaxID=2860135 RepID=UPI00262B81EB|nr:hypothetical protein [uncultured Metabacillus sp.]
MIKLNNTYLGFTNNLKPIQKAKQENTLDNLIRFENDVMKEKEFIYTLLQKGYTPTIEENYSYYSRRLDGMTKPKTDYRLYNNEEDSFSSVTKTAYNFAVYVIENDFLNEDKLNNYIINEKDEKEAREKAEQERIRLEKENQQIEREEMEAKREIERMNKVAAWESKGNQFMNEEIKTLIENTVKDNFIKHEVEADEQEKQSFINGFISEMPQKLGNEGFIIHTLQYHNEEGHKKDYFHPMTIEAEILMTIFNIDKDDSSRIISNKVKKYYQEKQTA